jgi:hypothetical protein
MKRQCSIIKFAFVKVARQRRRPANMILPSSSTNAGVEDAAARLSLVDRRACIARMPFSAKRVVYSSTANVALVLTPSPVVT